MCFQSWSFGIGWPVSVLFPGKNHFSHLQYFLAACSPLCRVETSGSTLAYVSMFSLCLAAMFVRLYECRICLYSIFHGYKDVNFLFKKLPRLQLPFQMWGMLSNHTHITNLEINVFIIHVAYLKSLLLPCSSASSPFPSPLHQHSAEDRAQGVRPALYHWAQSFTQLLY